MCGATSGGPSLEGIDLSRETVIQGTVSAEGQPVPGAFVRLLDGGGELAAEVVTSATGQFRFFAAPGDWTLRALSPSGRGEAHVHANRGEAAQVTLTL